MKVVYGGMKNMFYFLSGVPHFTILLTLPYIFFFIHFVIQRDWIITLDHKSCKSEGIL